jgi:hypothetical protein
MAVRVEEGAVVINHVNQNYIMRKISLGVIGMLLSLCCSYGQGNETSDSSKYKDRKLTLDEINFVSGYYHQDGDNSAVTGGIGTENLTDIANTVDINLSMINRKGNKEHFVLEFGIDHYTSASSDMINPDSSRQQRGKLEYALTSASREDTRIYPSLSWSVDNDKRRISYGVGISYSHEFDYYSRGANLHFTKSSKDNNREFSIKLLAFLDEWKAIYPFELRNTVYGGGPGYGDGSTRDTLPVDYKPRNSFQSTFSLSQVINRRLNMALIFDPSYMKGQLTTLYQRVYFNDGSERVEKLPDTRLKIAIGIRANYFLGDRFIIRAFYRFYHDDWGNTAHTASIETPIKLSSFVSLSPFYRFNSQSGINYFAPKYAHELNDTYYTSDYDLSKFVSHFIGIGFRMAPEHGVFGIQALNTLEIRYGHYLRYTGTGLYADIITLALKFK